MSQRIEEVLKSVLMDENDEYFYGKGFISDEEYERAVNDMRFIRL